MAKVSLILLVSGVYGDIGLPLCSTYSEETCLGSGVCAWSRGACTRILDDTKHIHPLDDSCHTYSRSEGMSWCANEIQHYSDGFRRLQADGPSVKHWRDCENYCSDNGACVSYVVTKEGGCTLCGPGGFRETSVTQVPHYPKLMGTKNCVYCDDFNVGYHGIPDAHCTSVEECALEGSTCTRTCNEKPFDANGVCHNFCYHEHKRCVAPAPFNQAVASVEDCETKCNEIGNCDSFEYEVSTSACHRCKTDEMKLVQFPDHDNWLVGKRTCVATTTEAPVTTGAPISMTTTASAIAPAESMVEPAAAAKLAKVLISKIGGNSEVEATDNGTEVAQQYSAYVFAGGLIAGMTASFLVVAAVRRQSAGAVCEYSAA